MKTITIKQLAKEYSYKIWKYSRAYKSVKKYSEEDFTAGFMAAQRWIPVEEGLPEERTPVIVMLNYKFYGTDIQATDVCRLVGGDWINCLRPQHSDGGVTHWRPINLI